MRILVLNWLDRENPQAGGAELHLHETFGRIVRSGHAVDLLCSGWQGAPQHAELDGIQVHRVGGRYSHAVQAPRVARALLRKHRPDIIVEDLNKIPLFAPLWSSVPVLLLVHHLFGGTAFAEASLPLALMTWLFERPIPTVYRKVPTVVVSESTRSDLLARGMSATRMRVVPNGLDHALYRPAAPEQRYAQPTLLSLGRVKRYKRIELTLEALVRVRERVPDARLLVAGTGDHEPALRKHAIGLGLGNAVEFLGFVSEARKVELLQRSWVHVFTSPKEGWGLTNLEAAACGTPSIASDSPGLRESVLDGRTGWLVPHGDVEALADACVSALQDPLELARAGARATEFAAQFTWERTAAEMEQALLGAAGRLTV
ncbi:MAG: glycosyltransferase family 4 protein [Gemmatimonadota bacterium]